MQNHFHCNYHLLYIILYKYQEFLIFYRFLSYPFWDDLYSYILPYEKALAINNCCDILDYGSGIPYGLIYALYNGTHSIKSISLIDLDLVHVDFVEYLIRKMAPEVKLKIYRLNDSEIFPELEGTYNLFFGQDIFEHLRDPLKNLQNLMKYSQPDAVCYFDFNDHGEKIYQHISPNISFLTEEMEKLGFQRKGKISSMTEFVKREM